MGHTVHEGDDSLMSFCKTSGSGSPGPFSWRRSQKNSPSKGGLPGLPRCGVVAWARDVIT